MGLLNIPTTSNQSIMTKATSDVDTASVTNSDEGGGDNFLSMILSSMKAKTQSADTQVQVAPTDEGEVNLFSTLANLFSVGETTEDGSENVNLLANSISDDDSLNDMLLEDVTFVQILQVLDNFSANSQTKQLPQLTDKLNSLFQNASVLEEFKGAKSIQDIVDLSNKYDLGLDKISITKEDVSALKKVFPNLANNNFFESKQINIPSQNLLTQDKSTPSSKPIVQEESKTTLSDILQSLDTKSKKTSDTKTVLPTIDEKVIQETKEKTVQTSKLDTSAKSDKTVLPIIDDEVVQETQTKNLKTVTTEPKVATHQQKSENLSDTKVLDQEAKEIVKTSKDTLDKTAVNEKQTQSILSSASNGTTSTTTQTSSSTMQNSSTPADKVVQENLTNTNSNSESGSESSESKNQNEQTSFAKAVGKTENLNLKSVNVRHTVNTFAQEFKEQVEQYKAPLMKVKLALNPKALGEMDVTIVNRGNNLQVNITSNTQAMNLFLQNQAEFKNSLVNMGFTNLEMNFSNQKEGNSNNQANKNKNGTGFASDAEEDEYFTQATEDTILEITLPNYV